MGAKLLDSLQGSTWIYEVQTLALSLIWLFVAVVFLLNLIRGAVFHVGCWTRSPKQHRNDDHRRRPQPGTHIATEDPFAFEPKVLLSTSCTLCALIGRILHRRRYSLQYGSFYCLISS